MSDAHSYAISKANRLQAELAGLTRYEGRPCYRCGGTTRTIHKNRCVVCNRNKRRAERASRKVFK